MENKYEPGLSGVFMIMIYWAVSGEHKSQEDRKLESANEIPFRSVE